MDVCVRGRAIINHMHENLPQIIVYFIQYNNHFSDNWHIQCKITARDLNDLSNNNKQHNHQIKNHKKVLFRTPTQKKRQRQHTESMSLFISNFQSIHAFHFYVLFVRFVIIIIAVVVGGVVKIAQSNIWFM